MLHLQSLVNIFALIPTRKKRKIKAQHPDDVGLFALHEVVQVVIGLPIENIRLNLERSIYMFTRYINGLEYRLIFRRYFIKNGRKIYPKKAKAFPIWVLVEAQAKQAA